MRRQRLRRSKRREAFVALFDDPAELAAPLAYRWAREHCRTDPVSGESCAWFHGAWLYLRALGIGQSGLPDAHRAFFDAAFGALARDPGSPAILISGSADYTMPGAVFGAYRGAPSLPRLTVVDICKTPLLVIAWYAARYGLPIAGCHSDILAYEGESVFDAICTHHFFNFFAPESRPALIAKWHGLLRAGGRLVLVNRFGSPGRALERDPASGSAQFSQLALDAARQRSGSLSLPDRELVDMLRVYRSKKRAFCLELPEELDRLLQAGGFAVETRTVFEDRRSIVVNGRVAVESASSIGVVARRL